MNKLNKTDKDLMISYLQKMQIIKPEGTIKGFQIGFQVFAGFLLEEKSESILIKGLFVFTSSFYLFKLATIFDNCDWITVFNTNR